MKLKLFLISIPLLVLTMFILVKHNKTLIISTYNEYRPMLLTGGGGEECLTELKQIQASYKSIGDTGTASCPILNAVRVTKYANTTLSSPFIVSCPTALSVGNWLEDIKAKSIGHIGTINCRSRRGSGLQSEHSFGMWIIFFFWSGIFFFLLHKKFLLVFYWLPVESVSPSLSN